LAFVYVTSKSKLSYNKWLHSIQCNRGCLCWIPRGTWSSKCYTFTFTSMYSLLATLDVWTRWYRVMQPHFLTNLCTIVYLFSLRNVLHCLWGFPWMHEPSFFDCCPCPCLQHLIGHFVRSFIITSSPKPPLICLI